MGCGNVFRDNVQSDDVQSVSSQDKLRGRMMKMSREVTVAVQSLRCYSSSKRGPELREGSRREYGWLWQLFEITSIVSGDERAELR